MTDGILFPLAMFLCFMMGFGIGSTTADQVINSPEITQSGTTWQGGECVIILNQK